MIVEAGAGREVKSHLRCYRTFCPARNIFRVTRWLEVCWTLSKFWKRRKVAWRACWPRKSCTGPTGDPGCLCSSTVQCFSESLQLLYKKATMYVPRMSIGGGRLGGGLTGGLSRPPRLCPKKNIYIWVQTPVLFFKDINDDCQNLTNTESGILIRCNFRNCSDLDF